MEILFDKNTCKNFIQQVKRMKSIVTNRKSCANTFV